MAQNGQRKNFLRIYGIQILKSRRFGQKILAYTIDGYETITYVGEGEIDCGTNWMDIVSDMAVACWCYPEVLCPKKGGDSK